MANHAAVVTAFHMSAQQRRAAGDNSAPRLLLDGGQGVRCEIGLAVVAQYVGQAHAVGHGRLAQYGVEQLQRRSGAGQLVVRQVKIAHGGRYVPMSEQALNGVDIGTGFQQMRGEAVAQGVDAALAHQAGPIPCCPIHALRRLDIDRPGAG